MIYGIKIADKVIIIKMNSKTSDFLNKILEKELELESDLTMESLNSLVESYRNAIVHFEEINSPKLWDYQERLQKILMRPAVLTLMQAENQKYRSQQRQNTRKRAQTHTVKPQNPIIHAKTLELDIPPDLPTPDIPNLQKLPPPIQEKDPDSSKSSPKAEKLANRMVETQQKRYENVITKAVNELKAQDRSLKDRLAGRKQKGLNSTFDTSFGSKHGGLSLPHSPLSQDTKFFFEVESEKSAGVNVFAILHERIEKIMEESFKEKTEKITEVRVRYGTQIGELEAEGGIYLEIIKQMKNSMEKEIEEISQEIDIKRKNLILQAKRELGLVGH